MEASLSSGTFLPMNGLVSIKEAASMSFSSVIAAYWKESLEI